MRGRGDRLAHHAPRWARGPFLAFGRFGLTSSLPLGFVDSSAHGLAQAVETCFLCRRFPGVCGRGRSLRDGVSDVPAGMAVSLTGILAMAQARAGHSAVLPPTSMIGPLASTTALTASSAATSVTVTSTFTAASPTSPTALRVRHAGGRAS